MPPALLIALLQQIVIPEVITAIRAHFNATGKLPSDAEVLAALGADSEKGISIGEAWLLAHPAPIPSHPPPTP